MNWQGADIVPYLCDEYTEFEEDVKRIIYLCNANSINPQDEKLLKMVKEGYKMKDVRCFLESINRDNKINKILE